MVLDSEGNWQPPNWVARLNLPYTFEDGEMGGRMFFDPSISFYEVRAGSPLDTVKHGNGASAETSFAEFLLTAWNAYLNQNMVFGPHSPTGDVFADDKQDVSRFVNERQMRWVVQGGELSESQSRSFLVKCATKSYANGAPPEQIKYFPVSFRANAGIATGTLASVEISNPVAAATHGIRVAGQTLVLQPPMVANQRTVLSFLPIEVVEVSPKTKDEEGNEIAGSEKPSCGKPLTPFVEVDPHANKIAHREIKVRIGDAMKDKRVTWTLEPLPGAIPATIRGQWENSPTHKDRFEASTAYGAYGFRKASQSSGETTVGADGHTAIRVNVPPIGFNQVRIKIQIEGMSTPMDLIDMEVPGVVVIDPGHGGQDSGTVGIADNTILEKDLALGYSLSLKQKVIDKFNAEKHGLRVIMTRKTTGEYMENALRANLARDRGADVFLSIHFNNGGKNKDGSLNTTARGTEYVTRSSGQVNAAEDDQLGTSIQGSTFAAVRASDAGARHRDSKSGGFAVVSDSSYGNTAAYHPIRGVIIEAEFLSHTIALETVKLSNATGTAIKTKFAADVSTDIYNNILNQP